MNIHKITNFYRFGNLLSNLPDPVEKRRQVRQGQGGGRVIESIGSILLFIKINVMKKIILGICLLSATTMIHAQNRSNHREVPMSVKESFHKDYPDADAIHWKYNNGKWNADFHKMNENVNVMAYYDLKGRRIDSRMPVAENTVPSRVIHRINDRYPGQTGYHVMKIDRRGKADLYQVKVKQHGVYKTLYLDSRGRERDYASR